MYQPPHFREDRIEVQHDLIRTHPLGLLISAGPGGLMANPIPFLIDADASARGTLRCLDVHDGLGKANLAATVGQPIRQGERGEDLQS